MEMTITFFYSISCPLIYKYSVYLSIMSNQQTIIKSIQKECQEFDSVGKNQVVYDKSTKSFIVKTQRKFLPIMLINIITQKLHLEVSSVIVNDSGFLNFSLTKVGGI